MKDEKPVNNAAKDKGEKKKYLWILPAVIIILLLVSCVGVYGHSGNDESSEGSLRSMTATTRSIAAATRSTAAATTKKVVTTTAAEKTEAEKTEAVKTKAPDSNPAPAPSPNPAAKPAASPSGSDLSKVPSYNGNAYVAVNDNVPYFSESDLAAVSYEKYSPLDSLGRCGAAVACIGQDLMPAEERGSIGQVKPTGWHTVKYDFVDGKYLYNRCHLIGYQLTGENANERNLITGTRYMNTEGMLPFENMVADYIKETGNHVLYRVTPDFKGNNLLASGVLMEAESVEDHGAGILFNVYCYNIQAGVTIDYATGGNKADGSIDAQPETTRAPATQAPKTTRAPATQAPKTTRAPATQAPATQAPANPNGGSQQMTYILNTNTKKFHVPTCSSIGSMSAANKQEYTGTREDLIASGYQPCGRCHP